MFRNIIKCLFLISFCTTITTSQNLTNSSQLVIEILTLVEPTTIQVTVQNGIVEGEILNVNQFKVNAFKGIPYAKAPIGPLQFKKPEPASAWQGVKITKSWPNRCLQSIKYESIVPAQLATDSQDCLYLNVFAPNEEQPDGYPVMVWIHGGGYGMGSTLEYGIAGITERIVPKGVVLVAIQYRLGIQGFFSTGDTVAPGNFGLWDMTMALKWMKSNIENFGGNPNNVTIFGESAGGAAVDALSISPHSYDLFNNIIIMSGTLKDPWILPKEQTKDGSSKVAKIMDCKRASSELTMACMREKDSREQLQSEKDFYSQNPHSWPPFCPMEDGDFFPESFEALRRKAPSKPMMIGITEMEGAFDVVPPLKEWQTKVYNKFDQKYFENAIDSIFPDKRMRDQVKQHYIYNDTKAALFAEYIKFNSDYVTVVTTHETALDHLETGPTWLYSFDYFNPQAFPSDHLFKGAHHTMELPYLFGKGFFPEYEFNEIDETVSQLMTTLWTNFAKFGNPTAQPYKGLVWKEFDKENKLYLRITAKPEMKSEFHKKAIDFWKKSLPNSMVEASNGKIKHNASYFCLLIAIMCCSIKHM